MSENTKIEWADHSWSPWRGCTKVSPGCANCYAETLSKRNPAVLGQWGKGKPRVLAKNWNDPVKWNHRANIPTFTNWDCTDDCGEPAHTYGPRPRVFPSICDWLDDEVPIEWLARFLKLLHDTPHLDWLILTKRPENWLGRITEALANAEGIVDRDGWEGDPSTTIGYWLNDWIAGEAPTNVWIGVSVEDQIRAAERIPILLKIPAAVRWLSLEPLLGPVDLTAIKQSPDPGFFGDCLRWYHRGECHKRDKIPFPTVDWLVIGGESGNGARPCNVEWVRSLVKQGKEAGVPVFVKQLGANPHCDCGELPAGGNAEMMHPKGGDPSEWPADLRVRKFPEVKP